MRGELYPEWEIPVGRAADPGVKRKAELVFAYALVTAPVDTGEYKSKIRLVDLPGGGYRVEALADHSRYVEWGTSKMKAYHTLATALDAAKG